MIFRETAIPGAHLVGIEAKEDERGLFARTWCAREFAEHGLDPRIAQCSVSFNAQAGTLRGMHYQLAPHAEAKLVRCTRGALFDVIVDLRADSPAYLRWVGYELSAENRLSLYVPEGCAHGFLTLLPATEVLYQMSVEYHPGSARAFRWNDPAVGIEWPGTPRIMSESDRNHPDLRH